MQLPLHTRRYPCLIHHHYPLVHIQPFCHTAPSIRSPPQCRHGRSGWDTATVLPRGSKPHASSGSSVQGNGACELEDTVWKHPERCTSVYFWSVSPSGCTDLSPSSWHTPSIYTESSTTALLVSSSTLQGTFLSLSPGPFTQIAAGAPIVVVRTKSDSIDDNNDFVGVVGLWG